MKLHVATFLLLLKTSEAFLSSPPAFHTKSFLLLANSPSASASDNQQSKPKKKPQQPIGGFQQFGEPINPSYCRLIEPQILKLIQQRTKARRSQNFKLADEILGNLTKNNVHLHDKKKLWRADGEIFDIKGYEDMEYAKASNSKPITEREEEYVNQKLRDRSSAKLRRDFNMADDILDELKFLKNVEVDDNNFTWQVKEPFKTEYTYGGKRLNNVPEEEILKINGLIKARAEAKERKDYKVADEVLLDLKVGCGVRVDDAKKAWFFLPKFDDDYDGYQDNERDGRDSSNARSREGADLGRDERMRDMDRKYQELQDRQRTPDRSTYVEEEEEKLDTIVPDGISLVPDGISILPEGISIPDGISIPEDPPMPDGISLSASNEEDTKSSHASPSQSLEDLEACTVPMLKEKLREAGLSVSGRKAELIERLQDNQ